MADAEQTWVVRRFAGLPIELPDTPATGVSNDLDQSVASYRATWRVVDGIMAGVSDPGQRCRADDTDPPVNLMWIIAYLLQETGCHAGHADILRELVDGQTGR
jgi:hypothetical protein